jgi:MoxR-like ATPase
MTKMPAKSDVTTEQLTSYLSNNFGNDINAAQVQDACGVFGITYATATKRLRDFYVKRGTWNLTVQEKLEQAYKAPAAVNVTVREEQDLIPAKDGNYVPFGNFSDVKKIIQSGLFYPTFITGLSGNGKTFSVEQACAQLKRELIRVNITIETDEDDLIGGFRLVNGETVWHNGPVIEALERGAILLLDEVDLASNKILCLQSILEGKGVFLKKIGKFIQPAAGFNIFATANTKGKGSEDGRFIGTNVLNEAFLERFALTFEQDYPTVTVETTILKKASAALNAVDEEFCENLANWADIIRKTFKDGGIDEVISTRRLVHIIRAFAIWQDRIKAIKVCVNRFDDETKQSFVELYDKIDAKVETKEEENVSDPF